MSDGGEVDTTEASFGALLRRLRLSRGYSVRGLAQLAGLNNTYLSRLERGAVHPPKIPTVHRLAEALELDSSDEIALIEASGRLPTTMAVVPRSGSRPDRRAVEEILDQDETPEIAMARVVEWVEGAYGQEAVRRHSPLSIELSAGAVRMSVDALPGEATATVIAMTCRLVSRVTVSGEIMRYLLQENMSAEIGALAVDEHDDIHLRYTVPGDFSSRDHLIASLESVAHAALHEAERIVSRWGGERVTGPAGEI